MRRGARLDIVGLGLIAVAVAGAAQRHGRSCTARDAAACTASRCSAVRRVAVVGFVVHQRRGAQPLMRLALFSHRAFAMGGCVAFIYGMALFGSTYLVPVFMQVALHLPPSQAGAVLLPAGLVLALTIPFAGRLADRLPINWLVTRRAGAARAVAAQVDAAKQVPAFHESFLLVAFLTAAASLAAWRMRQPPPTETRARSS